MDKLQNRQNPLFGTAPCIMGIVNTTPDSFSDGGEFFNPDKAIAHGFRLLEEGAHVIDVGGESTRPGAQPIDSEEEIRRVLPVIEGLKNHAPWISIDTRNAATMEAALKSGAHIINDISALTHDVHSPLLVAEAEVPVILMHMQGTPQTMQVNPVYGDVVEDIFIYFQDIINKYETIGIDKSKMVIDPGIGFGKNLEHNFLILRNIKKFQDIGVEIMLGISRKSFIGKISQGEGEADRLPGSLASLLWGYSQGVRIFRVHDVKETRQALDVYRAILE